MKRTQRNCRGLTMLETIVASAVFAIVMMMSLGVYMLSNHGMARETSRTYTQERVRLALDQMAQDCRGARLVLPYAWKTWDWTKDFYTSCETKTAMPNLASPPQYMDACVIVQVPAQDGKGIFYRANAKQNGGLFVRDTSRLLACIVDGPDGGVPLPVTAPGAVATDTVIYYYKASDQTLRRTTWPAKNVQATDGTTRSSWRAAEDGALLVRNVTSFKPVFKDMNGAATSPGTRAAQVDLNLTVSQTVTQGTQANFSVTGVRLRNMHNGSIKGVFQPAGGQKYDYYVEALYVTENGAYAKNSVVGTAWTDSYGEFEVAGLTDGDYRLRITPPQISGSTPAAPSASGQRYTGTLKVSGESRTTISGNVNYNALSTS